MMNGLIKPDVVLQDELEPIEQGPVARVLLLGGISGALPRMDAALASAFSERDYFVSALLSDETSAAASLKAAGADVVSLASMSGNRVDDVKSELGDAEIIGAGETESFACAPTVCCVNDVRIGVLACSERRAGGFAGRADILGLKAYAHVRMLLNQCDHVIVLVQSGLKEAKLPLPEWRARYRRFIDAGASAVIDTGAAKGWESYKNGLVFYGLGQPDDGNALLLSLSMRQNGKLDYEVSALEKTDEELRFCANGAFKHEIDAQNKLFLDQKAYQAAVDQMCRHYYESSEQPQKRGLFNAILPGRSESARQEEERLYALLSEESRRLMVLRALAGKRNQSDGVQGDGR